MPLPSDEKLIQLGNDLIKQFDTIFDLHPDRLDVRRYVRDLARVMIGLAADHGVDASFIEGDAKLVGVWVDEASPARWPGDPRDPGERKEPP